MAELDIHGVMAELAKRRPVFHSEADFQFALAWQIAEMRAGCGIRLEKPFRHDGGMKFLDLWLTTPGTPIELKYRTRSFRIPRDGEEFLLKEHSARDHGRYDFIADLARIEHLVSRGGTSAQGFAVLLTNDPAYWTPGSASTKDEAFRLHEGRHLEGRMAWRGHPSKGTTKGQESALFLRNRYDLRWKRYFVLPGKYGEFRYLAVKVE